APFRASAAGEHGVSLRFSDGTLEELPVGVAVPDAWRDALEHDVQRWPGVRIETKPHGLAVHYRLAPEREAEVWEVVRKPIFIGDDFTDEAGMSMARRFGGAGLRVAEVFGGDPAQVRAWLTHGMERMDGRPPPQSSSSPGPPP